MRSSDRAQVAPAPPRSLGPGALIEVVVDGLATRWPVSRRGGARCTPRFGASDRLRRSGGWVRRGADVRPLPLAAVWSRVPASWCARGTGGDTRMHASATPAHATERNPQAKAATRGVGSAARFDTEAPRLQLLLMPGGGTRTPDTRISCSVAPQQRLKGHARSPRSTVSTGLGRALWQRLARQHRRAWAYEVPLTRS